MSVLTANYAAFLSILNIYKMQMNNGIYSSAFWSSVVYFKHHVGATLLSFAVCSAHNDNDAILLYLLTLVDFWSLIIEDN